MKLVHFRHRAQEGIGLMTGEGIVNLSRHDPALKSVADVLCPEGWARASRLAARAPDIAAGEVSFLPLLAPGARIFCVGLNYKSHVSETGKDLPEHPTLFLRTHESLVGHEQPLLRPAASHKFDYEGELAVLIGRSCRDVAEVDAWGAVGGYTCCNEGSLRDFQKHSVTGMTGKNFDASGSLGPWIVPASEIPDPAKLLLTTRLNGQEMQRSGTDLLIYSIPRIISYLSHCLELKPGDVIATGTPAGVGSRREPPVWMAPGDVVEVEIQGIGVLRNVVADVQDARP